MVINHANGIIINKRSSVSKVSITPAMKERQEATLCCMFENYCLRYTDRNPDKLKHIKIIALLALKALQQAINHGGKYKYNSEDLKAKNIACEKYAELYSFFTALVNNTSLCNICVHRHAFLGDYKFSFSGVNYTSSAQRVISFIKSYRLGQKRISIPHSAEPNDITFSDGVNDINVLFHGSGDVERKATEGNLILSKINNHINGLLDRKKSHIVDGPSGVVGEKFTRNIFNGLENIIDNLNSIRISEMTGNGSITIAGHSRGGCEAIVLYNLFQSLHDMAYRNPNALLAAIPSGLSRFISLKLKTLIGGYSHSASVLDIAQKIKNINHVRLILIDPVKGNIPGFYRKGYKYADHIYTNNYLGTEMFILKSSGESRAYFDIHLPSIDQRIRAKIIKCDDSTHGQLVRHTSRGGRAKQGSHHGPKLISKLCGIPFEELEINEGTPKYGPGEVGTHGKNHLRRRMSIVREDRVHDAMF